MRFLLTLGLAAKRQRSRQCTGYRPGYFRGTILPHHVEGCKRDHQAQPGGRGAVAEGRQELAYPGARTATDGISVQAGGVTVMTGWRKRLDFVMRYS